MTQLATRSDVTLPSRRANPFATCWTRPGALPFMDCDQVNQTELLSRFAEVGCGQILGPHGSGKTTLLKSIGRQLAREGVNVVQWDLESGEPASLARLTCQQNVLFIDGYELLSLAAKIRLRLSGMRWIATTHRRLGAPLLATVTPSLGLAQELFAILTNRISTEVQLPALTASYHCHDGNLREVWFDLYDLHERLSRRG